MGERFYLQTKRFSFRWECMYLGELFPILGFPDMSIKLDRQDLSKISGSTCDSLSPFLLHSLLFIYDIFYLYCIVCAVLCSEHLIINKMWSLPLMILQSIFFMNSHFHKGVSVSNVQNILYYKDRIIESFFFCLGQAREDLRWGDLWTKSWRLRKLSKKKKVEGYFDQTYEKKVDKAVFRKQ